MVKDTGEGVKTGSTMSGVGAGAAVCNGLGVPAILKDAEQSSGSPVSWRATCILYVPSSVADGMITS